MHFIYLPALFSIKTAEEINERLNGLRLEEPIQFRNGSFKDMRGLSIPQSVDWRKNGLVSPVQNQVKKICYFKRRKWEQCNEEPVALNIISFSFLRGYVGPAGPSALWELLRARWRSEQVSLFPWAHRTWWTAAPAMGTWAAKEDTSLNPSATSSATEASTQRAFTPTNTRSSSAPPDLFLINLIY